MNCETAPKTGVQPQNFTIREAHDFPCIASPRESGHFDLRYENDEALDESCLDYPDIETMWMRMPERISKIMASMA